MIWRGILALAAASTLLVAQSPEKANTKGKDLGGPGGVIAVNGVRNRDVAVALDAKPAADAAERKRRSSRVTRLLRLLRAHGLLKKVPRSHLYRVTDHGRVAITAVLAARNATTEQLVEKAA